MLGKWWWPRACSSFAMACGSGSRTSASTPAPAAQASDCIQALTEAVMRREAFLPSADMAPAGASKGFNLSRWAIDHGGFTAFLLVLLLAAGVFFFLRIGQKEDPDFTFRGVVVQ